MRLAVAEKIEPLIAEHGGVPGLCHLVPRLVGAPAHGRVASRSGRV